MILTAISTLLLLSPPEGGPGLHFIDVGQGAALMIVSDDGELVIVDSGPAAGAEAILHALAEHEVDEVSLWIHTHYDADHIGGFGPVRIGLDGRPGSADDVEIGQLWDRGLAGPLPDSEALELYFALAGERREAPAPGSVFSGSGLRVEVLALDPLPSAAPENERGLALCVEVGDLRALLPGDLPAARVELAAAACGSVDVLWLSHHGAADGTSSAALELADPALTVISAGHDNAHCHPSALALALIHERTAWILDGAGVDPRESCPAIVESLGPEHHLVGGDLWIDDGLRSWLGGAGAWSSWD